MKRFYRIVLVMAVSDSTKKFTWRYNRVIMWQIVQRKIRIIECWSPDAFTLSENDCSRNLFLAIIYPFTFHIPIVAKAPTAAYWLLWNQIHQSVKSVRFFFAAVLLHQCTPGHALRANSRLEICKQNLHDQIFRPKILHIKRNSLNVLISVCLGDFFCKILTVTVQNHTSWV